jgi:hypothetical protein
MASVSLQCYPLVLKAFSRLTRKPVSGACDASYRCNITVAGTLNNLLVDGSNYGTNTSVVAWCDGGRCYGTASAPVTATAPFVITCDQLSGTQVCSATISGAANALFQNGRSVGKSLSIFHRDPSLTSSRTLGLAHTRRVLPEWRMHCIHYSCWRPNVLSTSSKRRSWLV